MHATPRVISRSKGGRTVKPPTTADVPLATRQAWPKLSADLAYPRSPVSCQSCGQVDDSDVCALERWIECDEWDRPTKTLVVICSPCARRIIGPHPRLYMQVDAREPRPGSFPLCGDCQFRTDLRCSHPRAKANGGPGVEVTVRPPTRAHLNYGGGRGKFTNLWPEWPTACTQRRTAVDSTTSPADTVPGA